MKAFSSGVSPATGFSATTRVPRNAGTMAAMQASGVPSNGFSSASVSPFAALRHTPPIDASRASHGIADAVIEGNRGACFCRTSAQRSRAKPTHRR